MTRKSLLNESGDNQSCAECVTDKVQSSHPIRKIQSIVSIQSFHRPDICMHNVASHKVAPEYNLINQVMD